MKVERFFEKFELFADAPNAVAKMRELVLNLALHGRLLAESRGKSSSAEWKRVRLDSVATIAMGNSPPGESYNERGEGVPLINGPVEFSPGPFGLTVRTKFTSAPTKFCKRGDLLICVRGSTTGRTNIASFDACIGRGVAAISAGENQAFVNLFLWQRRSMIFALGTGSTFPSISYDDIASLQIDLPPLAEQMRIVAKVDELMALCDRLEAQQQERETRHAALARASLARFSEAPTPANLDFLCHPSYTITPADLRKSILTLAVQGKLVPQDPNDGDARKMIDHAMEKRQQTIKKKSLRRKDLDESFDLFEREDLPSSWCVERIANLVDPENTISYGVLVPGNDVRDGIPFVRAQDLTLSNHPARPNKTIAPEIEKPYARTRLTGGEILLCVVGSIGKLGVVPDSWAGANIARAVARIKPIPDVLRHYLLLVLQEEFVQNYFTSSTRTLAQPTLNVGMIEQTPIPVPPLAEQRRIVAKVNQLMTLVDQLETQLAASRATAEKLMQALVAELTAQPAEVAA